MLGSESDGLHLGRRPPELPREIGAELAHEVREEDAAH